MIIDWLDEPEEHDYTAAADYLSLILPPPRARRLAETMKTSKPAWFKAKDIVRASNVPMLTKHNEHVRSDMDKVRNNKKLSPILLLRGSLSRGMPLVVADGYHRVMACYHIDENALVHCRIIDLDW